MASRKPSVKPSRRKPTVGNQPICPQQTISQIDPVWMSGRVPNRFWQDKRNRRNYLLWLGNRLGFRKMKDWYRITYKDIVRNYGSSAAKCYWRCSAIAGVKECFPEYDWQEWLFTQVADDFWRNPENRRRYLKWLGVTLGFRKWEDWYRVSAEDFSLNGGASMLRHDSFVSRTVMSCFPEYDWKPWLFHNAPRQFWLERKNRLHYIKWLGERLGYNRPEDWYQIKDADIKANRGPGLLRYYGVSITALVKDLFPRTHWNEWMFHRVPFGFWDDPENRKRYIRWLGKRLGHKSPADWRRIRVEDLQNNCGAGLAARCSSYVDLLRECLPEINWSSHGQRSRVKLPGREE